MRRGLILGVIALLIGIGRALRALDAAAEAVDEQRRAMWELW